MGESLESVKQGALTVRFDLHNFERLVLQLNRASNTLAAGIVIAGLLVGSSLLLRSGLGYAPLGYGGFAIALILAIWLTWNMFRGS